MTNHDFRMLKSDIDASVNFSRAHEDGGMVETRFVQRNEDRFIVYLSSFSGCNKACRFCHLTQTGQTMETALTRGEILDQAATVLDYASSATKTKMVHFNFMARGEPLSSPYVDKELFSQLKDLCVARGYKCRVKLSTIMPIEMSKDPRDLMDMDSPPIDIYYSMYSADTDWRKRWMPKSMSVPDALKWLAEWQGETHNRVILHWAIIDGENDAAPLGEEASRMAKEAGLQFDFNLVRYNPPNGKSRESCESRIETYLDAMRASISDGGRVKSVPRVGFDVKASCGMFLEA